MENSKEGKPVNQQGAFNDNNNLSDHLIKLLYSDVIPKHNNQASKKNDRIEFLAGNLSEALEELKKVTLTRYDTEIKSIKWQSEEKSLLLKKDFLKIDSSKPLPEGSKGEGERLQENLVQIKTDEVNAISKVERKKVTLNSLTLDQAVKNLASQDISFLNKYKSSETRLLQGTLNDANFQAETRVTALRKEVTSLKNHKPNVARMQALMNIEQYIKNVEIILLSERDNQKPELEPQAHKLETEPQAHEPEPQAHESETEPQAHESEPEPQAHESETEPQAHEPEPEQQAHEPEQQAHEPEPQAHEPEPEQQAHEPEPQAHEPETEPQAHEPEPEPQAHEPEPEPQAHEPEPEQQAHESETEQQKHESEPKHESELPQMAHAEVNSVDIRQDTAQMESTPILTVDKSQVFGADSPDAPVTDSIVSEDHKKEMVLLLQAQAELLQERIKIGEKLLKVAPMDNIILDRKSKKAKVDELAGIKKVMGEDVQYLNGIQAILQDKDKLAEYIEANGLKDKSDLPQEIDQLKKHKNEIIEKTNELKNMDYKDIRYRWYHVFKRPSFYMFLGRQAAWATPFLVAPAISGAVAGEITSETYKLHGAGVTTAVQQAVLGTYVAQKVLYVGPKFAARGMDKLARVTRKKFPNAAKRLDKVVDKVQAKTVTPIKNSIAHTRATISKNITQPIATKLGPRTTKITTKFKKIFHVDGSKNFTPEQRKLRNKGFNHITGERLSRKMRTWNLTKRGLNFVWRHKIKIALIVGLTVGAVFTAGAIVPAGVVLSTEVAAGTAASVLGVVTSATFAAAGSFAVCGAVLLADKLAFKPAQKYLVRREVRKREKLINQRFAQDKEKGQHQTLNQENKEKIVEIAKIETKEQVVTQEKTPEPVRNDGMKTMSEQVQVDSATKRVEPVSTVNHSEVQKLQEVKSEQPQAATSQSKTEVSKTEATPLSQPKDELRSFANLKSDSVEKAANAVIQKQDQKIQFTQEEQKKGENEKVENTKKQKAVQPVIG